jgi:UDP-glucose 4-epimerase
MKTILVTGGTGYIGSHTVVELISQGYNVVIVDNLSNSNESVLGAIEEITGVSPQFFKADLTNEDECRKVFLDSGKIEAVIHFAAFKAVGESVEKPLHYYRNNLYSLINVLWQMKEHSVKNLVFSSSCTVYGQPDKLPVTENSKITSQSPYGNTKKVSEEVIIDTTKAEDIHAISLRYFNPIGAHHSSLIGELPNGVPNNLVPFITQTAIGLRDKLKVWGSDYSTPDGTCIRDYIHVVDLAKAHVIAIQRLIDQKNKSKYEFFNLGTGKGNSVMEVIKTFIDATKVKLNYELSPRRPGDVEQIWSDTSLANKELNWKAEHTLEQALVSAWNWELALKKRRS